MSNFRIVTRTLAVSLLAITSILAMACATPTQTSTRGFAPVDAEVIQGGVGANEIRTVASQMAPSVLALPEVSMSDDVVRIALSPMKNSSRFVIDMNVFLKRLRLELNRYGQGQVRFFSQGQAQVVRGDVLAGREEAALRENLNNLGREIAQSAAIANAPRKPVRVAVVPVLNSNLVNMNADSFVAMLRGSVVNASGGSINFLMPGAVDGADFYLTGQFIAESMRTEAIVNLAEYLQIAEDRVRRGESLSVYGDVASGSVNASNSGNQVIVNAATPQERSFLEKLVTNSRMQVEPNVTKHLNVMLVKPETKASVFEKMITISNKQTEGLGNADYIITGEITSISKRQGGRESDYILITMQLVDPATNELLWEDGYELKKSSQAGIVYQ